jgi:hypothetical protein
MHQIASSSGVAGVLVALAVLFLVVACGSGSRQDENGIAELASRLPTEISGWTASESDEIYDSESIFTYIDGHAEVYLAYGMRSCLARQFEGPNGEPLIVLDIFEMPSSEDAFGVWTHDREGEAVNVGQDAVFRYGWLSAWQDRFFISIYAEEETELARDAVLELADAVTSAVGVDGKPPTLLGALPEDGLDRSSVRFIRDPVILRSHLGVDPENTLGLDRRSEVVLGHVVRPEGEATILVAKFDDEEAAAGAFERFNARKTDAADGVVAGIAGNRVAAICNADSAEFGESLFAEVMAIQEGK